jgi:5-methylcytosine-specific restriction endonuclease McrA
MKRVTPELIQRAKKLYDEYGNYSKVGRILNVCSETVRVWLNSRVRIQQRQRDASRKSKTYYTKYKNNPTWVKLNIKRVKIWYAVNKQKVATQAAKRYIQNGGYKGITPAQKIHIIRRRELRKQLDSTYTTSDLLHTQNLFNQKCAVCNTVDNLQLDHWLPLSKGNGLTRTNAVLLCSRCNRKKSNQLPESVFPLSTVIKVNNLLASTISTE